MPVIQPQPGPQTQFLSTPADIAIMGGGNDGGKTFGLLMDVVRHSKNANFEAIYFRRETPNITNPGGLWDEAVKMYGNVTARVTSPRHQMRFGSGARITFGHLQHETDKFSYDGAQIPAIYFDQLEQFTSGQFWHMFGRNRSTCGVKPYIRATCNPAPKSWLAELIQWYWDPETGYAIPERSGVIRYFVRDANDKIQWANSPEELAEHKDELGQPLPVISFTFILALIHDNKIALEKDPARLGKLLALPYVERERRLKGNWKIEDVVGDGLFKPEWWRVFDIETWKAIQESPTQAWWWARGWDPAGGQSEGSDFSSGALVGISKNKDDKRVIIADITRGQWSPHQRNEMMKAVKLKDGPYEPFLCFWKSRTPDVNTNITEAVEGCWAIPERGRKFFRAQPLAVKAESGLVWLAPGEWIADFIKEASLFKDEDSDDVRKDDQVDSASLAYAQVKKWH